MQQLRVQYWHEIGKVKLEDLARVDETGSNLAMTRHFEYSPQGSRAYNDAPYQRGQNLTLRVCKEISFTFFSQERLLFMNG